MFSLSGQVGSSLVKPKILYLWVYSITRKGEQSIMDWLMKVFDMSSCNITTAFILQLCSSAKERHYVSEVINWTWKWCIGFALAACTPLASLPLPLSKQEVLTSNFCASCTYSQNTRWHRLKFCFAISKN